jgi:class 3 adenylate cyclase
VRPERRGRNTGIAYVGSFGEGPDTEMTAMGDVVNAIARLSSVAAVGDILMTAPAAASAGPSADTLERLPAAEGQGRGDRRPRREVSAGAR